VAVWNVQAGWTVYSNIGAAEICGEMGTDANYARRSADYAANFLVRIDLILLPNF
jgi:hypothetical protein